MSVGDSLSLVRQARTVGFDDTVGFDNNALPFSMAQARARSVISEHHRTLPGEAFPAGTCVSQLGAVLHVYRPGREFRTGALFEIRQVQRPIGI